MLSCYLKICTFQPVIRPSLKKVNCHILIWKNIIWEIFYSANHSSKIWKRRMKSYCEILLFSTRKVIPKLFSITFQSLVIFHWITKRLLSQVKCFPERPNIYLNPAIFHGEFLNPFQRGNYARTWKTNFPLARDASPSQPTFRVRFLTARFRPIVPLFEFDGDIRECFSFSRRGRKFLDNALWDVRVDFSISHLFVVFDGGTGGHCFSEHLENWHSSFIGQWTLIIIKIEQFLMMTI